MLTQLSTQRAAEARDLIALLGECHERIRHFVALAEQAGLRDDAPPEQIVQACLDVERYFTEALPLHVADEEESIEPRLRGRSKAVDAALDATLSQHRQHDWLLQALLEATRALRVHPTDERARDVVASTARRLAAQFEEHLGLEEGVLFPAIRQLSPEAQSSIVAELRARRRAGRRDSAPATLREGRR